MQRSDAKVGLFFNLHRERAAYLSKMSLGVGRCRTTPECDFSVSFVWSQKINWTKKVELHLIRVNFDIERDADGEAIIGALETYEDTCTVTVGVQAEAYDRAWNAILDAQALNSMQMTIYVRGELENWGGSRLIVENILFRFDVR